MRLKHIKRGQIFWECTQHGQAECLATCDAWEENGGWNVVASTKNNGSVFFYETYTSPYGVQVYDSPQYSGVRTEYLNGVVTYNPFETAS